MQLEIATNKDSEALVAFFKDFPVKGLVDLKVDRHQNFFAPYLTQSEDFKTYLLKDSENKIHATASFIFRDVMSDGKILKVANATDLRVSPHRRAILDWTNHFLPVLQKETETHQISSVFSMINLSDPSALNTFIRPRAMKRRMPRYFLYRKFKLVSLHGRYPWAKKPLASIKIRAGSAATYDALLNYLVRRSQYRPFASIWDESSFQKKLQRLSGMKLSDFSIAYDSEDNVVGCMAPWSASNVQNLIPLSYTLRAHNFRQFLKFFWVFGMTRRLAKPVVSTGMESPLQMSYLTNVFADNEDVFESLLYTVFDRIPQNEFLLYAHTEQDYRLLAPKDWISANLPYALYAVSPPEKEMPDFISPSIALNPEIEAYTVI